MAKLRLSTCGPSSAAPLCLLRQAAATLVQRLSGGILLLPLSPPLSPVKGDNRIPTRTGSRNSPDSGTAMARLPTFATRCFSPGVNEGCTAACRCCTPHPLWISSLRAVATGPWPASVHLAAQDTWIAGAQVNAEASGASDRRSFAAFTGLVGAAALAASFTPATPCRCEPDGPTPDGSGDQPKSWGAGVIIYRQWGGMRH